MWPGKHALERPDHVAYVMAGSGETVTYRHLNDRSNRLAQLFYDAGLRFGDHIAVLMENRVEFFEPCWAAQRSGLSFTCIFQWSELLVNSRFSGGLSSPSRFLW